MGFAIRDARAEDLQAVGRLAGRLVRLHHSYDPQRWMMLDGVEAGYARYFASQLGEAGTIILVACDGDEIVAYAYAAVEERNWAELRDRCGRLHDIFVIERARRRGLAKNMLRECIRRLAAHDVQLIVTTTAWQNQASQALMRSLGFRPTAVEFAMGMESSA
jgi:ribosomal protein S18 acetylase RimI-like enzyme